MPCDLQHSLGRQVIKVDGLCNLSRQRLHLAWRVEALQLVHIHNALQLGSNACWIVGTRSCRYGIKMDS